MKKLAFCLRGHLRCWGDMRQKILEHIVSLSSKFEVTVFIASPPNSEFKIHGVYTKVEDSSLDDAVNFLRTHGVTVGDYLEISQTDIDAVATPVLMDNVGKNLFTRKMCNALKRRWSYQNKTKFDIVLDTRPDVFLEIDTNKFPEQIDDFEYYSNHFKYKETDLKFLDAIPSIHHGDVYFISNDFTNDLLSASLDFENWYHNKLIFRTDPHDALGSIERLMYMRRLEPTFIRGVIYRPWSLDVANTWNFDLLMRNLKKFDSTTGIDR